MNTTTHLMTTVLAALKEMRDRAIQRRELAGMTEYALKDIGLTRTEALAESAKPFWR
jgi:uncharacterized protein YjiS (DUF1127 family)